MAQVEDRDDTIVSFSQGTRMLFYLMSPNETLFAEVEQVPQYVKQATPFFIGMILLEGLLGWLKTGDLLIKINDGTTSLSAGMMSRLPELFMRSLEVSSYIYVWNNFHILELPWDSAWTWWLAFLGVDFGYYWVHRCSHELNILWAAHQVHHSSEYYNLTTALRQSVTQQFASWVFYLPMALIIPPSVFAVHIQFNLLYQFWIHTEFVRDLGPLEWILNTPSHHRVHHGRNRYCIDKNYGGTLIIWDRMLGTFAPEDDKVIYGLTHPINTFDILSVEFEYYTYLLKQFISANGITHKLSVIFSGPGWTPGKPRLGDPEDLPEITGEEVPHNPHWSSALQAYVHVQFLLVLVNYNNLFATEHMLSQTTVLLITGYILLTLTILGYIMDLSPNAALWEMSRCLLMLALNRFGYISSMVPLLDLATEGNSWGAQRKHSFPSEERSCDGQDSLLARVKNTDAVYGLEHRGGAVVPPGTLFGRTP
ncbi:alkylglycerol monooxygenase isoform X2 [Ictalurus punctatus]|uniref:Alkylglycerol monooxygenase n=1 Tax=Ictalurus punctatus TaxID=7998 RepID=A0A9F7RI64_ICTPU|nr:alkylglycerol monooxygenase isoform X2 [Ictalurus punctatus]